jgi:uncharacterized membrane protein YphA (DoxX/SURF4 family)
MGYYFLHLAWDRIMTDAWQSSFSHDTFFRLFTSIPQFDWFGTYVNRILVPVSGNLVFPLLLTAAPILLGVSLVIGLWTRLSAAFGILYVLHYYLVYFHGPDARVAGLCEMQIAVLVVLLLAASGRTLGLDGYFWRNRVSLKFQPPTQRIDRREPKVPRARDLESIPLSGDEKKPAAEKKPNRDMPDFGA